MVAAKLCEEEEVFLGKVESMCQQLDGFFFSGTLVDEAQLQFDQIPQVGFLLPLLVAAALSVHCKMLQEDHHLVHNLLMV